MNDPTATSDLKLKRLNAALEHTGAVRGVRNKHVAEATGYKEGSVRGILSGNAVLSDRFIKAVCIEFNIRRRWIEEGEEPMLAQQGEAPYPSDSVNGIINSLKNINLDRHQTGIGAMLEKVFSGDVSNSGLTEKNRGTPPTIAQPISGLPYPRAIAGPEAVLRPLPEINCSMAAVEGSDQCTSVGSIALQPMSDAENAALLTEICGKIHRYYSSVHKNDLIGISAQFVFLWIQMLPPHEMIDLFYQLRKISDGDSDHLAVAAANERLANCGLKRVATRLKLERIPVVDDDEKQEK